MVQEETEEVVPSPTRPGAQPRLSRSVSSEHAVQPVQEQTNNSVTALDRSRPAQREEVRDEVVYRNEIERRRYPHIVHLPISALVHPPEGALFNPRKVKHCN